MTIYTLGSINIDHVYRLAHLPAPGETLAAQSYAMGLGGKGANQSVAAARAGARVVHLGAVGPDGDRAVARLAELGVETGAIARIDTPTGHAIINVDEGAENTIVLFPGANRALPPGGIAAALVGAGVGDTLLMQNETAHQAETARLARAQGLRVVYSAAPFDVEAVRAVLENVTILAVNAVEAEQLSAALGVGPEQLPVEAVLITRGAEGAEWCDTRSGTRLFQRAFPVRAVDTTGAGDTFAGYVAAALDQGLAPQAALRLAAAASAIKVTRSGAADAIPSRAEVDAFLAENSL